MAGRSHSDGQQRPFGQDPAQTVVGLNRDETTSMMGPFGLEELHTLTRGAREIDENPSGPIYPGMTSSRRSAQDDEFGTQGVPATGVAPKPTMGFQCGGQTMGRRARKPGSSLEISERCRARRHGVEQSHGLVEYSDPRYAVHQIGRLSQIVGSHSRQALMSPRHDGAATAETGRAQTDPTRVVDRMNVSHHRGPRNVMTHPTTLAQKIWDRHVVHQEPGQPDLLYIDLHLVHEVTSPQAFDGLRLTGRTVRRPDLTVATEDHNVPTADIDQPIADPISARQVEVLRTNTSEFGITNFPMGDPGQGIVHVIGPEQGRTLPGMTIVCGDSHTATHGAFGALAFGIGTSEVEHVLATQTLPQSRPKWMSVTVEGTLRPGVTAKDVILHIIGVIGTGGGIGHVIEYRGSAIRALSMEGRMTVCNMSIEAGAKAGLIAPDDTTFEYLQGRPHAPSGAQWEAAVADWRTLVTDEGAVFDTDVVIDAADIAPQVSWGTNPAQVTSIDGSVPSPEDYSDPTTRETVARALEYMGLTAGTKMRDVAVDTVFIGSCTNSRIEDLRAAAEVMRGRSVTVPRVMVVPGSHAVKAQAEAEGLPEIFRAAGADWREPGCSMCLAMNPDKLTPGERSASTSNRNFEGRQGRGGRTHLVSPAVAAATAVTGTFATPDDLPAR